MASYLNGRLPATMLGKVPGTSALCPLEFIPQVEALRAAFYAEFGVPLKITDGYRPYEGNYYAQVETMLRNYKPAGEFRRIAPGASLTGRKYHVWNGVRRYLLPGKPQVAFPGKSNHGRPDRPAIDFGSRVNVMDSREHKWMVANAPRFGFVWPSWARAAREGWHFEGARLVRVANTITIPSGSIPTPTGDLPAPLTPEDDMTPDQEKALEEIRAQSDAMWAWLREMHVPVVVDLPQVKARMDELNVPDTRLRIGNLQHGVGLALDALSRLDGIDIDEHELAQALAPLVTANLGALPDHQVQDIAKAAADEQDRRTRERLTATNGA